MRSATAVVARNLASQLFGSSAHLRIYDNPETGIIDSAAIISADDTRVLAAPNVRMLVDEMRRELKRKGSHSLIRRANRVQVAKAFNRSVAWVNKLHQRFSDLPFTCQSTNARGRRYCLYNVGELREFLTKNQAVMRPNISAALRLKHVNGHEPTPKIRVTDEFAQIELVTGISRAVLITRAVELLRQDIKRRLAC